MTASTPAVFDPQAAKYRRCCCGCCHVESLTKFIIGVFVLVAFVGTCYFARIGCFLYVPLPILPCVVLILALQKGSRLCLLVVLIFLAVSLVFLLLSAVLLIINVAQHEIEGDYPLTAGQMNSRAKMDEEIREQWRNESRLIHCAAIAALTLAALIVSWVFSVLRTFYAFLRDRELANIAHSRNEKHLLPSKEFKAARAASPSQLDCLCDQQPPTPTTIQPGAGYLTGTIFPEPGPTSAALYPVLDPSENREYGWK